ncbi:hypothetical protein TELCIR_01422 [Teladorsagia circumcincta]|uniref:Uncharacterized protein n=1 Tax=Teladorsagia circumcincta TaxID=45464 RepID=A0A2G9V2A0_TELCI|nr:hypothetical protein TELCIR_01422 [Teladorsagia circumcincta]
MLRPRAMLATCVTVTVIFAMLMYEISYSLKETVEEAMENIITDDSSAIFEYDHITFGENRNLSL